MSYQKYMAACRAAGRAIPVDEYLASLSETERREVERQSDFPTSAGQFDLTQPTQENPMEEVNETRDESSLEESLAAEDAYVEPVAAEGAESADEIEQEDEPSIDLASPPEIEIPREETAIGQAVTRESGSQAAVVDAAVAHAVDEVLAGPPVEKITGAVVARDFAGAPDHVEFPEETLPLDTEIVKTPSGFLFKIPGRTWVTGHGRSLAAALIDAHLI